ncbi:MAG: hypothetical protein ACXW0L_00540 [Methylosarcina sp.]
MEVLDNPFNDNITFDCYRCGRYTITPFAEAIVEKNKDKFAPLSSWLREMKLWGKDTPLLTASFIEDVIATIPNYSPIKKQNKLLKAIELLTHYPGERVELVSELDAPLAWAQNSNEFDFYLSSLIERELINSPRSETYSLGAIKSSKFNVTITAKGWEHLETFAVDLEEKTQVFVAMSFDTGLLSVYTNSISPAIKATGYHPYRVDSEPHLDRIDAKIIAEIKNSKFVVADVTQQKSGVYFEAGFAYGFGLPVIWCVRSDDLRNVHFDTRQYPHIVWDNELSLKKELENFIIATIGKK